MLSQGEGCIKDMGGGGGEWGGTKRVKGTINHQLHKFTPLGLVFRVTVMYFHP